MPPPSSVSGLCTRVAAACGKITAEAVKWYRHAAEQGDADAQFNLGKMYAEGQGVPQADTEALKWYRRAADQGNADAQSACENLKKRTPKGTRTHTRGEGETTVRAAERSVEPIADNHTKIGIQITDLALELLKQYRDGIRYADLVRQISKEDANLNVSTIRGSVWNLGAKLPDKVYKPSRGLFRLTEFRDKERGELSKAAQSDDAASKKKTSGGRHVADQGYVSAQASREDIYAEGPRVRQDVLEAMHRYRRAAKQGDAAAQFNLGFMYAEGRGVPQDDAEAVKWYRRAADQGYAAAQDNLGFMYDEGRGVPQNYAEALKWYRRAADQSYAPAQYNLGAMYEEGQGVPRDDTEAVKWFRSAADQGDADAQFNLGLMYDKAGEEDVCLPT